MQIGSLLPRWEIESTCSWSPPPRLGQQHCGQNCAAVRFGARKYGTRRHSRKQLAPASATQQAVVGCPARPNITNSTALHSVHTSTNTPSHIIKLSGLVLGPSLVLGLRLSSQLPSITGGEAWRSGADDRKLPKARHLILFGREGHDTGGQSKARQGRTEASWPWCVQDRGCSKDTLTYLPQHLTCSLHS